MKALFHALGVLILVVGMTLPVAAQGSPSADVSVTQSVHHDGRYSNPGPPLVGNPTIPNEYWFIYDMHNAGPDPATVTLKIHPDTFRQGKRYNFWTLPMQSDGLWYQGGADDCNFDRFTCKVRIRPGRSYRVMVFTYANAPGPFSIYANVTSSVDDPDRSNNRTPTFDKRVVCAINGTPGPDRLVATEEPDSICGWEGNDRLIAVGSKDKLFGHEGKDVLSARGDADAFIGGPGRDTASFANSARAVSVSLRDRTGGGKALLSIEAVIGSRFGDYLTGLTTADRIVGGPGNDRIAGRGGRDAMFGGSGDDRFISADGTYDLVKGGRGDDVCQADSGDTVRSARRVSYAPFYLDP